MHKARNRTGAQTTGKANPPDWNLCKSKQPRPRINGELRFKFELEVPFPRKKETRLVFSTDGPAFDF